MKVIAPGGEVIELGATESTPSIGIVDYSRRETDDFGVTTVVKRGFARRMSVRLAVPFGEVDTLQQRLAALRATSARWVADDRFGSLDFQGFYKDFALDLNVPPLSWCTLTIEGLAETESVDDPGGDPAPDGAASTLQLLQPVALSEPMLVASTAPDDDYPQWIAEVPYMVGTRVLRGTKLRVYENVLQGNTGHDPAANTGQWLDIGPINRWAMFDEALGTATTAIDAITVTLDVGAVDALALLDVVGTTVRVQVGLYDRTVAVGAGAVTFLDLPSADAAVTVTIAGAGEVSVGTLLTGHLVALGITEASPTAGITDYSRKDVDDFGEVTIVERAWAKRMAAKALIRTDAIDLVANRLAAVRARACLWIGAAGIDSLTVYGFFKEFSIEVDENVSMLALSIEGLSKAPKLLPPDVTVDWPEIADPTGTKPEDNATVGAPPGTVVGDRPAEEVVAGLDGLTAATAQALLDIAAAQTTIVGMQFDVAGMADQILAAEGTIVSIWDALGTQGASITTLQVTAITQAGQLASLETDLSTANANISLNASAITGLDSSVSTLSTNLTSLGSSVTTLQQAITTLDGQTAVLEARIAAGGGNLCPNSTFENGFEGWNISGGAWAVTAGGNGWGSYASTASALPDGAHSYLSRDIGVEAGGGYTLTADMGQFINGGTGLHYTQLQFLDASNGDLGTVTGTPRNSGPNFDASGLSRQTLKVTAAAPAGAVKARIYVVWYKASGAVQSFHVRQVKFERGILATAYSQEASVLQSFQALSTLDTQYASLSTTVSTQGVTISSQQTAITTVENGVTTLFGRAAVTVEVGGVITGWETNNNGTTGDFKVRADRFEIVPTSGSGARSEFRGGTLFGYDASGVKRYQLGDQALT